MATLLGSARLVTLLGPGGVGKTRVALAAAASAARCHRDGACFVDLTKVRDAELVPELIAAELGVNSDTSSDA